MKKTITEQLRELGFTPKEIKKINNYCVHNTAHFKFADLSHVDLHTSYDGEWLHLFNKDEWYGLLCLKVCEIKGE